MTHGTCRCMHPNDPHLFVVLETATIAGVPEVPSAGVVLCPECDCTVTWSVAGYPAPEMPEADFLSVIRGMVFSGQ